MSKSQARAERRYRDREQQRAAANRRIGHDLAYWIWLGPGLQRAGLAASAAAAALWAWAEVDHRDIAVGLTVVGVLLAAVYAGRNLAESPRARMLDRASGRTRSAWHPVGIAAGLLLVAALMVWRSL